MNLPEVCLLASCAAITLSALAGFADSLLRVPLTLGGSGARSGARAHTHSHVYPHTWARCSGGGFCLGVGKRYAVHSVGIGPAAATDTWTAGLSPVPLSGSDQRWLSKPARGSP